MRPVGLDRGHVAGQDPAHAVDLDERPRGLLGVAVIAEGDVAAAGQPADGAGARRDRLGPPSSSTAVWSLTTNVAPPVPGAAAQDARLGGAEPVGDHPVGQQREQPLLRAPRTGSRRREPITHSEAAS